MGPMAKNLMNNRRDFIKTGLKTIAATVAISSTAAFIESCTSSKKTASPIFKTAFTQEPLPYAYNALEDIIDAATMEIHYSKHAAGYAKKLNELIITEKVNSTTSVEELLANISQYSSGLRNNAGGHYNHELFWKCMQPKKTNNQPTGELLKRIEETFGSFAEFKKLFSEKAKTQFGSGWAWLYRSQDGKLKVGNTPNQDNPLMNVSSIEHKGFPLLCIDVWEHAYYLKYQNKRADYVENWWSLVNWDYIQKRFESKS